MSWAIVVVGTQEYRAAVRGGYVFLADLPVHWGDSVSGQAFTQGGDLVFDDQLDLPPPT